MKIVDRTDVEGSTAIHPAMVGYVVRPVMLVFETMHAPSGGLVEFPALGTTGAAGCGVEIEFQYVMSIHEVDAITLLRVYVSEVKSVALPKATRAAVLFSQFPGPEFWYSAKVTKSVRGSVVDHAFQPAGLMIESR